jgi:hypothetical protein
MLDGGEKKPDAALRFIPCPVKFSLCETAKPI